MEFNFELFNEKDIFKKYFRNLNEEVFVNKLNKIIGRE